MSSYLFLWALPKITSIHLRIVFNFPKTCWNEKENITWAHPSTSLALPQLDKYSLGLDDTRIPFSPPYLFNYLSYCLFLFSTSDFSFIPSTSQIPLHFLVKVIYVCLASISNTLHSASPVLFLRVPRTIRRKIMILHVNAHQTEDPIVSTTHQS